MEGYMSKKQSFNTKIMSTTQKSLAIHKSSHSISKSPNNNNAVNKPKIRIIHIFAPEIIKTDAENFRELVQRLTGKPTEKDCPNNSTKKKATTTTIVTKPTTRRDHHHHHHNIMQDYHIDHDDEIKRKAFPIVSKPLAKKLDMNKSTSTTTTTTSSTSTSHEFLGFDAFDVIDQRVMIKEEEDQEDEIWKISGHDHHDQESNNNNNNITLSSGGFLDRLDFEGFIEELDQFPLLPSLLNPNLDSTSHFQYGFGPQLA